MKRLLVLLTLLLLPSLAYAEVHVRDDISVTGNTVTLAARTMGFILPRGGDLVEFRVNGESLGEQLSGGDGWAYREFLPKRAGLYTIEALSGEESAQGYMLALSEGAGVVFVDVQGALVEPLFSRNPIKGSRDALQRLAVKYPVVYLSTELPASVMRKWLDENDFPRAPLLEWRGGKVFDSAVEKGLRVKAVIGGASVVQSAIKYERAKLFTFGQSDEETEVESWEDLEKGFE